MICEEGDRGPWPLPMSYQRSDTAESSSTYPPWQGRGKRGQLESASHPINPAQFREWLMTTTQAPGMGENGSQDGLRLSPGGQGAPATEILPRVFHAHPLTLILPIPSRAHTLLPAGSTLRLWILVRRDGRSWHAMWERGRLPSHGGRGAKGMGFFSRLWGRRVGTLFSSFPFGGAGAEVGAEVLWEGGWESIRSRRVCEHYPPQPSSVWGKETCPSWSRPSAAVCLCSQLFQVVLSVCSFLECISVCLSVSPMSVSGLLWEEVF